MSKINDENIPIRLLWLFIVDLSLWSVKDALSLRSDSSIELHIQLDCIYFLMLRQIILFPLKVPVRKTFEGPSWNKIGIKINGISLGFALGEVKS